MTYSHGQFSWVDLVAHDLSAAAHFYCSLFGWAAETLHTESQNPYTMFSLDGDVVAGAGQMDAEMMDQGVPPMWNSYINVDDVSDIATRAGTLGATITVAPMNVLDAGRLAFFQDPTGATIGLWQAGEHTGAGRMNAPGTFCWNELATRDAERAQIFYADLFGWTYRINESSPSEYYIIENDGRDIGGIILMTDEWGEAPPHWSVYFAVSDTARSARRVVDLGGTLHHGPFDTPVGPIAAVSDPQGAMFYVIALTEYT